jgi:hypothetical protein
LRSIEHHGSDSAFVVRFRPFNELAAGQMNEVFVMSDVGGLESALE